MSRFFTFPVIMAALGGLLVLQSGVAHAQRDRPSYGKEIALTAGYGPALLRWPTFEEFLKSYGAANRSLLKSELKLENGTSQSIGIGGYSCYFGYQGTRSNFAAEFTDGSKRNFMVRQGLFVLGIEPRFWLGNRVFLGPTASMCFGQTRLNVTYTYPDGTESWGNDRRLNGQYDGTMFTGMLGAKTGLLVGPALIQLKADYMFGGKGVDGISDLPALSTALPRHYDQYLTSVNGPGGFSDPYSLVDDAVKYDLGMIRVVLEVGIRFNRNN